MTIDRKFADPVILGIDFTSAPGPRKPISCVEAALRKGTLSSVVVHRWTDFDAFESVLAKNGPWIAACDFPFGLPARFIRNIGWPSEWREYVAHVEKLGKERYCDALTRYRQGRPAGDKEHKRLTDKKAGSISPQKLLNPPVGKMFFRGAPILLRSTVCIPGVKRGDADRVVVEGYPGALARYLIGRKKYKDDARSKQLPEQYRARLAIVDKLRTGALLKTHGVRVDVSDTIANDPGADDLDALLCAVQAAAAWLRRDEGYGVPADLNPDEGWIAEPTI